MDYYVFTDNHLRGLAATVRDNPGLFERHEIRFRFGAEYVACEIGESDRLDRRIFAEFKCRNWGPEAFITWDQLVHRISSYFYTAGGLPNQKDCFYTDRAELIFVAGCPATYDDNASVYKYGL